MHVLQRLWQGDRRGRTLLLALRERGGDSADAEETDALTLRQEDRGRLRRAGSVSRPRHIARAHSVVLHHARVRNFPGHHRVCARMDHHFRGAAPFTSDSLTTADHDLVVETGLARPALPAKNRGASPNAASRVSTGTLVCALISSHGTPAQRRRRNLL